MTEDWYDSLEALYMTWERHARIEEQLKNMQPTEVEMTRVYVNATCPKCEGKKVYVQGSLFVCEACDFQGEPGEFIYQAQDEGDQND